MAHSAKLGGLAGELITAVTKLSPDVRRPHKLVYFILTSCAGG